MLPRVTVALLPGKLPIAGWEYPPFFNRKYIFNPGSCSIATLVYRMVSELKRFNIHWILGFLTAIRHYPSNLTTLVTISAFIVCQYL